MSAQEQASTAPIKHSDVSRESAGGLLLAGAGLAAALGAASCCVVPFLLFTVGISGAWIANLTGLAAYQPLFVAASLGCLGAGFILVRRRARTTAASCAPGSFCAAPASNRLARVGLWTASAIVFTALVFPHVAFLFFD